MNSPSTLESGSTRQSTSKGHTALVRLERLVGGARIHPVYFVGCWALVYVTVTLVMLTTKPFWNDELFTFYISRLGSMRDIWNVLLTGAEQIPPFFFVVTRWSESIFGFTHLGLRLPEFIGFGVTSVCLFHFVRKRLGNAFGLVAMLFPLVTGAYDYAFEARPYGLVLGYSGLALCFWQTRADGRKRGISLVGLALCVAAAMSSHYYAVLSVIAICIGEAARSLFTKKLDLGVWAAVILGGLPLLFFLPLIRAARTYASAFWSKVAWTNMVGYFSLLLGPSTIALFCILIVIALCLFLSPKDLRAHFQSLLLPAHERVAVCTFCLIPAIAVILGKATTGAFNFRYALPAVIGVSILLSWSVAVLAHGRNAIALLVSITLMGAFGIIAKRRYLEVSSERSDRQATYKFLDTYSAGRLPIVIAGPHMFFELSYEAAQHSKPRSFVYLADAGLAATRTGADTAERGLITLQRWAPLNVQDFHGFSSSHDTFLLYGYPAAFEWVTEELIRDGRSLAVQRTGAGRLLYLAEAPR